MKRYDEYNNIHIKNDSLSSEYGRTQNNEFSDFSGNPGQGRSSANEMELINDDREKNGQIGRNKNKYEDKKEEQKKQETIKQATNVATSSATSAVATTAGAVAGASVIAVATVGATLGAAIASSCNAKFKFLEASSHSIFYELNLELETDEYQFMLYIENEELGYKASDRLVNGINEGEFYALEPETEYYLYVQSTDMSKTTILDKYVTTEPEWVEPEPEPEPQSLAVFKEFYFSKTANFRENSFDLSFTYEDPLNEMSDFEFTLACSEGTRVYALQKTEETQTLYGSSSAVAGDSPNFDLTEGTEFSYEFSYYLGNERKVVDEGTVIFTDNSNAKQEFRGIEVSREADFLDNVIYVTLDFDNDLNHLSNFVFTLKSDSTQDYIFNLETTTDKQALRLDNAIRPADGVENQGPVLEDTAFSYTLSYTEKGVSKTVESEEPIIFDDISGAVQEFRSLTIHENANYIEKCFYVTLDFDNDYLHFSNFTLSIVTEKQAELTFNLRTTTDKQTVYLKDAFMEGVAISEDMVQELSLDYAFDYSYSYKDKGQLESFTSQNPITFHDESGAKSEFRGITIDSAANFLTKDITVTLDLDNDYGYYRSFALRLQSQGKVTLIYNLEAVNTTQTLKLEDADIESVSGQSINNFNLYGTFYYELTYFNSHTEEELSTTGSLTFTDNSGLKSEFRGINFETGADYAEGIIYFSLDLDNELNEYSGFTLRLSWDNYTGYYDIAATNARQSVTLSGGYGNNRPSYYDLSREFNYELSFTYLNSEYRTIEGETPLTFTDIQNRVSEVRGLTIADHYDMQNGTLEIQLDSVDDYNVLSNFVLFFFRPYMDGGDIQYDTYSFAITETSNVQTIDLNEQELYFDADTEYQWKLTYTDARYGAQELSGTKTITPMYEIHNAEMYTAVQRVDETYYGLVYLNYADNVSAIDGVTLKLMSSEHDNDNNPLLSRSIALEKKNGYQYVNITQFLNEWHETIDNNTVHDSGTATGLPRDLDMAYGISFTINNEVFEWNSYISNTLDLHDGSKLVGAEALTTSMSASNPTFEFKLYGRDPFYSYFNYYLEFQVGYESDSTFTFNFESISNFNIMTDTITIDLSNYADAEPLINAMRNQVVTVRLYFESYDSNSPSPLILLVNTQISIND